MSFAQQRQLLAAQLANNVAWSTFSFPPAVPQANSVVIEPDDPYIESNNMKGDLLAKMRVRVRMYVPLMDNEGNLAGLEDMAQAVRARILDGTQNCGPMSGPSVFSSDTGDLLTAYFPLELLTEWDGNAS
jgi:hypothetical protein